ncbi:MAG: elongation factor G [Bacteroidia bacterium]|nr:elongation factor G [Bacteroidia bacterium]
METKNIRNVVLLGHSGSGKTTFAECMLFEANNITRRGSVTEGNTSSDYTGIEQERQNSIFSSLMHANWRDNKINIIDTPGSDDFVGEVISSMKVADTGVMLLNAKGGVEVGTELIWAYVSDYEMPCIFVINHLDNEKADYETTLEQAQSRFGSKVVPIQFPLNAGDGFNQIVDCLRMVVYKFPPTGGKPEKIDIPEDQINRAQEIHNQLVEIAAENDEGLMEIFFDQGTLTEEELTKGLQIALASQQFFPVFCCSAEMNMGSGRIMGFINDIGPSPLDRPEAPLTNGGTLKCDKDGEPVLFLYKIITEPKVGKVTYFKVFSGVVRSGDELYNNATNTSERISQLYEAEGKNRNTVDELVAGDIGVTVKLKDSHTSNTLAKKGSETTIAPINFPNSRIRVAVKPPSKAEMEKLSRALHMVAEEDPTLIIEQSSELNQTILHAQGELHLEIIRFRIERIFNIGMEFIKPKISYRETITKAANASYRHKKQSGGSGQFAEVHMRIEPYYEGMAKPGDLSVRKEETDELPWGGKLVFLWCIVGGSIDAKFSNAIKKGIMNKMMEGPLTGSRCQDIRVCIYDGKMHPVDSNDMAFQLAAQQVFKIAFEDAKPQILEPIYDLEILCDGDVMGDIMSDLQTRRAIIMGMDSEGHYQKIKAKAPLAELYKYSSSLRSLSQGKAKFNLEFSGYESVTNDIQQNLKKEYHADLEMA